MAGICPFGRSHVDSPIGDLDFSGGQLSSAVVAVKSQLYPFGSAELFPVVKNSRNIGLYRVKQC